MNEFSQLIKTSKTDEYYTPRYAVEIIVPFLKLKKYKTIWCPFDKKIVNLSKFYKKIISMSFTVILIQEKISLVMIHRQKRLIVL